MSVYDSLSVIRSITGMSLLMQADIVSDVFVMTT